MHERDLVFRERLIAMISELHAGASADADLKRLIGGFTQRLVTEASVPSWADLKERADGPTYDSMLKLFMTQSEAAAKKGDSSAVRAFGILALSLIARRQYQEDLKEGVAFLDGFIEDCVREAKRTGTVMLTPGRPAH
jgi:hypothetical protein